MADTLRVSFVDRLILGMLFLGLIVLLFFADPEFGPVAQGAGIALVVAPGLIAAVIGFSRTRLSSIEVCLLLMAALSLLGSFLRMGLNDQIWSLSVTFSSLLPVLVLSNAALIRRFGLQPVFACSAWALAAGALIVLVVEFEGMGLGLTSDVAERWNYRLAPLGLHPNIAGIIFSLAIGLSLYQVAIGSHRARLFFSLCAVLQAAIVGATGSRGGIFACVASIALVVVFKFRSLPPGIRSPIVLTGAALVAVIMLYWHPIYHFLAQVFELESSTRGWNSGATNRVDYWSRGVEYLLSDNTRMVMGDGLRTANPDEIGFSTENSYITILIESGIPLAVFFFGSLLLTVFRLYAQSPSDAAHSMTNLGALAIIQFAMIESFFNRYLLAIGNPASVIFLLIFVGGWLNTRYQVATPPIPSLARSHPAERPRALQS